MRSSLTVPALLDAAAVRFGSRPAIVDGDIHLTYAELVTEARRVARAYLATGVSPGDRVAIWTPNRFEYVLALLGAQVIGASVVPLNTRYRGQEARVVLERSRASVLVVCNGFLGADYVSMLAESVSDGGRQGTEPVAGLPHLHTVVDLGSADSAAVLGWEQFLAAADRVGPEALAVAEATVTPETVCDILFTMAPVESCADHAQSCGRATAEHRESQDNKLQTVPDSCEDEEV